jgi:hypothetical protein
MEIIMGYTVKQILADGSAIGELFSTHPEAKSFIQTLNLDAHKAVEILDDIGARIFHYINPVEPVAGPLTIVPTTTISTPVAAVPIAPGPTQETRTESVEPTKEEPSQESFTVTPTVAVTETETQTVENTSK